MVKRELFEGKYRIIKTLGQGGMGKVYLAENINLGSLWAIKEISKKSFSKADLLVEPNILKKLNHPSLPRIFDIIEDEKYCYIIVDYIEGVSLDEKLREEGRFPENTVIKWAKQLCDVLIYLHSFKPNPIIYRDMKPSNIILTGGGNIKLIDFGIAREYKSESEGDTVYIGTRGYAAPEQYGIGQTNAATDIYSLGVTLYELITGKSPNQPPYEIKAGKYSDNVISRDMELILDRCTRREPSDRYQSVEEVLDAVNRIGRETESVKTSDNQSEYAVEGSTSGSRCPNFKKLVITVWDNVEFGCELAYTAARISGFNVMLVDLDLLAPKADLYLNIRKTPERISNEGIFNDTGVNIAMDSIEKNFLTGDILIEASVKRRNLKNLFVLTGNYRLENYEYYKDESLIKLIEKCYQNFDITILLVNKFLYDSYTVISLIKSDFNLVPVKAEVDKVREFNGYIRFLKDNQHIPMDKTKFVAFEYDGGVNLSESALEEITEHNYIGKIGYSKRRIKYRNLSIPYARRMEKEILSDYINTLSQFCIVPKATLGERIRAKLGYRFS